MKLSITIIHSAYGQIKRALDNTGHKGKALAEVKTSVQINKFIQCIGFDMSAKSSLFFMFIHLRS